MTEEIIERDGIQYRVAEDGTLIPLEILSKRFVIGEDEMTSGMRRAMNYAPQPS